MQFVGIDVKRLHPTPKKGTLDLWAHLAAVLEDWNVLSSVLPSIRDKPDYAQQTIGDDLDLRVTQPAVYSDPDAVNITQLLDRVAEASQVQAERLLQLARVGAVASQVGVQ